MSLTDQLAEFRSILERDPDEPQLIAVCVNYVGLTELNKGNPIPREYETVLGIPLYICPRQLTPAHLFSSQPLLDDHLKQFGGIYTPYEA